MPALLAWFARTARDLPWRRTIDPYAIWVSEVMLQQTQVKTVWPYWERWMKRLPTIAAAARARPQTLHKLWEGLGYYTRVRNLQKAARLISQERNGVFPQRFEDVLRLPGIGRYTAGAICSIAYDQATPILDGNVMRVLTRLFAVKGDPRSTATNATLWQLAQAMVKRAGGMRSAVHPRPCSHFNQALMELGALVCTPRQPKCDVCPVSGCCQARRQNRIGEFPNPGQRIKQTPRRFAAFVIERNGKWMICRRPREVVNAQMWEFPNVEIGLKQADLASEVRRVLGRKPGRIEPLFVINQSITRYQIRLVVARVEMPHGYQPSAPSRWVDARQAKRLPFPSAHGKILKRLAE